MSISRRSFVQMASVAAIAAGTVGKSALIVFAQDSATDPLSNYTQATFIQYINSIFRLHGFRTVDVTLEKVEDTLPATVSRTGGRESFVLHFRGGGVQLPQDTYTVEHPALGTFKLFLVPNGVDENGAQSHVATFNRLAHSAKTNAPRALPRKSAPTLTPKTDPSAPPKVAPETKSPDPAEKPKPQVQPRRRKIDPEVFPELDYQ